MPVYNVSVNCHGMVTVQANSEDEALEKASKTPHNQVFWENGYEDMEAFLKNGSDGE